MTRTLQPKNFISLIIFLLLIIKITKIKAYNLTYENKYIKIH